MAIKSVRPYGNQIVVFMDDGTKVMCFSASDGFYIPLTGGSTGPTDPTDPPVPGDGTMIDPFPGHYDANDPFGNVRPSGNAHTGSDWNGIPEGTPIPAIANGQVVSNLYHPNVGNTISVKMEGINPSPEYPAGSDVYYAYLHMQSPSPIPEGANVSKGQIIGLLGNTGESSIGAHLHITISSNPAANLGVGPRVDPYAFIHARL